MLVGSSQQQKCYIIAWSAAKCKVQTKASEKMIIIQTIRELMLVGHF
jgi:hypothetical protein